MLDVLPDDIDDNAYDVKTVSILALVTEKVIHIGDGILDCYNFDK